MTKDKIAKFVWNETEFSNVDPSKTDYLMGLFEPYHMQYEYDRRKPTNKAKEPSLADKTEKAIKMLERSPKGFFLLAEGGRIDHAHHDNNAARALIDTIALHEAVERANKLTKEEDTLIVVTADHSHVFTYAGYPSFHNPILGISNKDQGADPMPFAVLGYYNGPGFFPNLRKDWQNLTQDVQSPRKRVLNNDTMNHEYVQPAAVPLRSETHAGEDVGIYARGPMSHLFARNHENIYLAHAMMFASCVGPNQDHCKVLPTPKPTNSGSVGQIANVANLFLYICAIFIILLRR